MSRTVKTKPKRNVVYQDDVCKISSLFHNFAGILVLTTFLGKVLLENSKTTWLRSKYDNITFFESS